MSPHHSGCPPSFRYFVFYSLDNVFNYRQRMRLALTAKLLKIAATKEEKRSAISHFGNSSCVAFWGPPDYNYLSIFRLFRHSHPWNLAELRFKIRICLAPPIRTKVSGTGPRTIYTVCIMPRCLMAKKWKAYSWPNRVEEDTNSQPTPPSFSSATPSLSPAPPCTKSSANNSSSSSSSSSGVLSGRIEKQAKQQQRRSNSNVDVIGIKSSNNNEKQNGDQDTGSISGASSNTSMSNNNISNNKNESSSSSNSANPLNYNPPSDSVANATTTTTIITAAAPCPEISTIATEAGSTNCTGAGATAAAAVEPEDEEEIDVVGVGPATNGSKTHLVVASSSTTSTTSASCWGPSSPTVSEMKCGGFIKFCHPNHYQAWSQSPAQLKQKTFR